MAPPTVQCALYAFFFVGSTLWNCEIQFSVRSPEHSPVILFHLV